MKISTYAINDGYDWLVIHHRYLFGYALIVPIVTIADLIIKLVGKHQYF